MRRGGCRYRLIPAVAGWQFYKHRGLDECQGLRSRIFPHSCSQPRMQKEPMVAVTLMANNKEGIDFYKSDPTLRGRLQEFTIHELR